MSASEIINELPKLTVAERRAVLSELLTLIDEPGSGLVDLSVRGINAQQAADLRARLNAFAEDWERPEAAIYDENPPR